MLCLQDTHFVNTLEKNICIPFGMESAITVMVNPTVEVYLFCLD